MHESQISLRRLLLFVLVLALGELPWPRSQPFHYNLQWVSMQVAAETPVASVQLLMKHLTEHGIAYSIVASE